jgi:hypothetical protein
MSWLRELSGIVGGLPGLQKKILLGLCFAVLGAFVVPFFQIGKLSLLRGTDNTFYYFWLRSAMVDGDWDFANDLEACNTLTDSYRSELRKLPRTEVGRLPNKYGIGWALLSVPFYLVADGAVAAGRAVGLWNLQRDGYNVVYQVVLQTGHFLLGLAGLLLAWRCVRHWCGDATSALWGVLLILLASPELYYLTMKLSLSHNAAFFAIALMTWACLEAEQKTDCLWPWLVMGAGWGLAVTLRFQLAIYGLIPAWAWLAQMRTAGNRGTVRKALAWLVGALPLLLLQFYAWRVVYGRWFVFTYGAEGERFNWSHPEISNVLFSPYHGLFYWHPFLVVGLIGLGWLAFKMKGVLSASLLAFAGTVYVNAAWWCWWFAGNSFGSRAFEAALLFFMGGLAYLFVRSTPRWRRILFGGAMLAVVWNLYLMVLFYGSVIDRNAPVTWTEMIQAGPHMLSGSSQSRTP